MNIKELEKLLKDIQGYLRHGMDDSVRRRMGEGIDNAITYCRQQQRRAAKRKLEFRLKADEQRELLR